MNEPSGLRPLPKQPTRYGWESDSRWDVLLATQLKFPKGKTNEHELLRELILCRLGKKISREALANKVGVASYTVERYERGAQSAKLCILLAMGEVLGLELCWREKDAKLGKERAEGRGEGAGGASTQAARAEGALAEGHSGEARAR